MACLFDSPSVRCKQKGCEVVNRLPVPNHLDQETIRINAPTASEPLRILCKDCWRLSTYSGPQEISTQPFPDIALSGETPIYLIEFVCGESGCGLPIRVYKRDTRVLPENVAIYHARAALGGLDAKCPAGHFLSKGRDQGCSSSNL